MKILLIEHCNYIDTPTGGQLNFAKNLLDSFSNELLLVGSDSDKVLRKGVWSSKQIDNTVYDFFCLDYLGRKGSAKPLIPARITSYFKIKKYISKILNQNYDYILIQAPEALFAIPKKYRTRVIFRSPGVANPLINSRYKIFRYFSPIYDRVFFHFLKKCPHILATASDDEIIDFQKRALNVGVVIKVKQFPTRYDERIYYERERVQCREVLGIDQETILFSTVGRLNWHKGWKLMIDSFREYLKINSNAMLLFIGNGEDENIIRNYISVHNLDSKVLLTGRMSPEYIAIYLNASNAYISGSYKEGWSTSLVEACACNIPAVVTDFSSAREMVTNGVNGFVLSNRNEEQFAEAMDKSLTLVRNTIRIHNEKFSKLAVSKLRDSLLKIILQDAK